VTGLVEIGPVGTAWERCDTGGRRVEPLDLIPGRRILLPETPERESAGPFVDHQIEYGMEAVGVLIPRLVRMSVIVGIAEPGLLLVLVVPRARAGALGQRSGLIVSERGGRRALDKIPVVAVERHPQQDVRGRDPRLGVPDDIPLPGDRRDGPGVVLPWE
jgi:hypothetical protein